MTSGGWYMVGDYRDGRLFAYTVEGGMSAMLPAIAGRVAPLRFATKKEALAKCRSLFMGYSFFHGLSNVRVLRVSEAERLLIQRAIAGREP